MALGLTKRRRSRVLLLVVGLSLFLFFQGPSKLGFGTSLFPTTHHKSLRFKASSVDWADAKLFFPPQFITPLPRAQPKKLPRVQSTSAPLEDSEETQKRRAAVKDVFIRSWRAYKEHAWTWDEVRPVSGGGKNTFGGWAATLVDSLDTLWIMGCVLACSKSTPTAMSQRH